MKPLDRVAQRLTFRRGLIAVSAMTCLALSSACEQRVGIAESATNTGGVSSSTSTKGETNGTAIRPFRVTVPDADVADLKRRLASTRWPDKETVANQSQGAQLGKLQALVRYWATDYDWRKAESKLNAFPQFMTTIDGVDIHFIHVRSRHQNALPLIVTHGWPLRQAGIPPAGLLVRDHSPSSRHRPDVTLTTTRSIAADTSRLGKNRPSSCRSCARRSSRCGSTRPGGRRKRSASAATAAARQERGLMDESRRSFLGKAAMVMAAAQLHMQGTAAAADSPSRQLVALGRAKDWLNSPPLLAATLHGKVTLVQFGTYTCINWLRTLPYIRAWAQKYRHALTVIGVHTPEFTFEKDLAHVRRAVQQVGIEYPVAIDNDYAIWRAFNNRYWPALYFVDARGRLRHQHFGEGEYAQSEMAIQRLLAEAGSSSVGGVVSVTTGGVEAAADWGNLKSPEIYLGHDRTANFSSRGGAALGRARVYAAPARLGLNQWALAGDWTMANERAIVNKAPGRLVCRFHARDIHLVMGPPRQGSSARLRASLDGQRPGSAHGLDVDEAGSGVVAEPRLYQLIRQRGPIVDHTLEIEFLDAGVEACAFTFG
jgi:hypothetical protein